MNHTPAQLKAIQAWTEQRDALLREIGIYTTQLDELKNSTKAEALSFTDIQNRIAESRGRLAEMDALETRMRGSVATDIAELEVRKARLIGECESLDIRIEAGNHQYAVITAAVSNLESAHKLMEDQAAIVNRVVGEIIETSQLHTSDMKNMRPEIRSVSNEVIEKGNENIKQTNIVLGELPRYIFELQRPIPVRRAYATTKGTIIRPKAEGTE